MLLSFPVFAQQYHMVPSGDPAAPYRVEQIIPPDVRDLVTFDGPGGVIETLRGLEGIDPGATVRIMQGAGAPAVLCSNPQHVIVECNDGGLTVQ